MLANLEYTSASGSLSRDLHLPAASLYEFLNFVENQLPCWRDRKDRKPETSETSLTADFCAHLNSAARHASLDFLQFRTEVPDSQNKGRTLDLVASPCGTTVWIEGRCYLDFDPLLPIECKRLPTPKRHERDQREYVITGQGRTGGIQRFKAGLHGPSHRLGAMIAYVQHETRIAWQARVAEWIEHLASNNHPGWTGADLLELIRNDDAVRLMTLRSSHVRENGLPAIELIHFWVQMN